MEWIKVSERLPSIYTKVFVTIAFVDQSGDEIKSVGCAFYGPGAGTDWTDGEMAWRTYIIVDGFYGTPRLEQNGAKVIAWMPYPESYQGD